jgi:hypothetical protein
VRLRYTASLHVGKRARGGIPADPNDTVGPAGFGPEGFILPAGDLPYIVRFENKPTATATAQVVTVTQDLDWDTFQLGTFGFGAESFTLPAGRQSDSTRLTYAARNIVVDVAATFDPATGRGT